MKHPNPEQREALRVFATYYGVGWRRALRWCWTTGMYECFEHEAKHLHSLKDFGPVWLMRWAPDW